MSPIPTKLFSRSGTWRIILTFGLVLISIGMPGNILSQNPNGEAPTSAARPEVKGKNIFEAKCATCHGLDGLGGEHAPDIIRRPGVKSLSDQALLGLIHDGIPEEGMPSFSSIGQEGGQAVVAYIRFLQGKSAGDSAPGDPIRGKELFGKAGCSACHQIGDRGQFVARDLAGFARDHPGSEIRDAILRPSGELQETATVVGRDGRKFSGMIRNEDNASMQLQDRDGRFYLLMKSSLVSVQRKAEDSMPLDYAHQLSGAELDDLVGYILHEAYSGKVEEPHAQD
ncbi:MAG: c-type cytochrome [Candidatus Sulfotelmatobacter sp.]|jgi:cytochrome c oxidase cbb3-type subunit 3